MDTIRSYDGLIPSKHDGTWEEYSEIKQKFLSLYPSATCSEIEEFCKKLAEALNL